MSSFEWRRWTGKGWRFGNDEPHEPSGAVYERCEPSPCLVLDVVVEPVKDHGHWAAHWQYHGGMRKGRAVSVEEAKQEALDAAETMLAEALEQLETARITGRV